MSFTIHRLSLIALLFLISVPAYAEWRAIGENENDGGFTLYVDPATVRRKGDLVKMWIMYDYKTAHTSGARSYLSIRSQQQYDCAEERLRHLAYTYFSDNMGKGDVVSTNSDEGKWLPIAPGSIGGDMWNMMCGKE